MTPQETDEALIRSLGARPLSRNERRALVELFDGLPRPEDRQALVGRAFELARSGLIEPEGRTILDWLEEVVKLLNRGRDEVKVPVVPEAHFSPGEGCARRIAQLFARARKKVDICVFTITDDVITSAILDAHRRGVALRIITDNDKLHDEGSDIERLSQAGIPLRVDRTAYHMHHKFAIFDASPLLTGSYNWTRSASLYNNENFIITGDAGLIASFASAFDRLWKHLE